MLGPGHAVIWGVCRVALKVLHPSHVGTGRERSQYVAEAQRLHVITHPSVVKVLADGQGARRTALSRNREAPWGDARERGGPWSAAAREIARGILRLCSAVAALPRAKARASRNDLAAPASTTTQEGNVRGTPADMRQSASSGSPRVARCLRARARALRDAGGAACREITARTGECAHRRARRAGVTS